MLISDLLLMFIPSASIAGNRYCVQFSLFYRINLLACIYIIQFVSNAV